MSDVAAFLTARLDEDERNALDTAEQWAGHFALGHPSIVTTVFLKRHDPSRVLREVEAKRKILAQYMASPPDSPVLTFALHQLAAVYCDHPDFDPEWRG